MSLDLEWLSRASEQELADKAAADPAWAHDILAEFLLVTQQDRREVQLAYYRPVNPMAAPVHVSTAREIAIVGGNRSSKTDTMLAELAIQMTNHVPMGLQHYPKEKLRGPIRARVVCNSLTDTLEPVIKPKLRWDQWSGVGDPNEGRGHWGWIPRHCLVGGSWEKAYSEKYRTLHVSVDTFWRGADGMINRQSGVSSCQFLSYDQDLSAFTGSSMHFIGHDELPPSDIYRENRMRTLDVKGQIMTAFTPPDEVGASRGDVAWFFDNIYEPGLPGPQKHPHVDTFILHTEKNEILAPAEIALMAARLTEAQREVRLLGKFVHLSGVIYADFTQHGSWWCFKCTKRVLPVDGVCTTCSGTDLEEYRHIIAPFPVPVEWPVLMVVDPHPRKADAIGWFAITPSDDLVMVGELAVEGTAGDVARAVSAYERAQGWQVMRRIGDPNMLTESNDRMQRGWTIRRAYDEVGLHLDLANDEMNAGIQSVREYLRPDPFTRLPRLRFVNTCAQTIYSMSHWVWAEYSRQGDREPKERPHERAKDNADLVRYAVMARPTFQGMKMGGGAVRYRTRGRAPS